MITQIINTETGLQWIAISILALKIFHMEEEANCVDASERNGLSEEVDIWLEQRIDLLPR
jgi:hypothetical protein